MQQRSVPPSACPSARKNFYVRGAVGLSTVPRMERPCPHARGAWRGVTLIELLLVLAILALVAATAWPSLERSLADQRLRDAADTIRAEWQHARAQAMSSGVAYQFHYMPEERVYWIEPCDDATVSSEPAASASANALGQASESDRQRLPDNILFVEGRVQRASAEAASSETSDPARNGQNQVSDEGELNAPLVFSPDGTCSTAQVTLRNEYDRGITLSIHGLTAIAVVGEVAAAGETSP